MLVFSLVFSEDESCWSRCLKASFVPYRNTGSSTYPLRSKEQINTASSCAWCIISISKYTQTLTYCLKKNGDISGGEWLGWGLSNVPLTLPSLSSRFSSCFQCSIRSIKMCRQWSMMFSFHKDVATRVDIKDVGYGKQTQFICCSG